MFGYLTCRDLGPGTLMLQVNRRPADARSLEVDSYFNAVSDLDGAEILAGEGLHESATSIRDVQQDRARSA
jgi:hypothetical protein